jgi:hypothetical protein
VILARAQSLVNAPLSAAFACHTEGRARWSPTARVGQGLTLHLRSARWLVWSPLRVSSDHRIVGALRAQRPYQLPRHLLSRPRVARAQEITTLFD